MKKRKQSDDLEERETKRARRDYSDEDEDEDEPYSEPSDSDTSYDNSYEDFSSPELYDSPPKSKGRAKLLRGDSKQKKARTANSNSPYMASVVSAAVENSIPQNYADTETEKEIKPDDSVFDSNDNTLLSSDLTLSPSDSTFYHSFDGPHSFFSPPPLLGLSSSPYFGGLLSPTSSGSFLASPTRFTPFTPTKLPGSPGLDLSFSNDCFSPSFFRSPKFVCRRTFTASNSI